MCTSNWDRERPSGREEGLSHAFVKLCLCDLAQPLVSQLLIEGDIRQSLENVLGSGSGTT